MMTASSLARIAFKRSNSFVAAPRVARNDSHFAKTTPSFSFGLKVQLISSD